MTGRHTSRRTRGGDELVAKGDFLDHDYEIRRGGHDPPRSTRGAPDLALSVRRNERTDTTAREEIMPSWKVFRRDGFRWHLLLGATLLGALAVGLANSRQDAPAVEPAAEEVRVTDVAASLGAGAPEAVEPRAAPALTARRAFMRDCARPTRSRERIRLEHLFESGCISQLSAALGARAGDSDEARKLLAEHRANLDSIQHGGWGSREQPRRVRDALLSATELMEKLVESRADAGPELRKEISGARKAALSIREGVPLAEQTERADAFFRHAGEALRLMGERNE